MKPPTVYDGPPHSIEAEQGIVGCLFRDPTDTLKVFRFMVHGECPFYDLRHETIMDMALEMDEKQLPIGTDSMAVELRKKGKLESVGGSEYLNDLASKEFSAARIDYHCAVLMDKAFLREGIQIASRVAIKGNDPGMEGDEFLNVVQNSLSVVANLRKPRGEKTLRQQLIEATDQIQNDFNCQGRPIGVETGLPDFDQKTHGLRPGVIILAARPGMGKSAFAMNAVEHAIFERNLSVIVFSLEMSGADLLQRMLYSRARVDSNDVLNGHLESGQHEKINLQGERIDRARLKIVERTGVGVMDIRAESFDYRQKEGLDLVVVDYLQLLKPRKNFETREREIAEMSRGLKELAQDLKLPVLVLAQLNRDIEKENRRPRLSDLRESGAIEQDADMVVFLYNSDPETKGKDFSKVMPVGAYIAKNRKGQVGTAYLTFLKKFTRFESASRVEHD